MTVQLLVVSEAAQVLLASPWQQPVEARVTLTKDSLVQQAKNSDIPSKGSRRKIVIKKSFAFRDAEIVEKAALNLPNLIEQSRSGMEISSAMHFNQTPNMGSCIGG